MNARKWWAIPLMIVGGMGAATAIYIESKGGGPFDLRWLAAIALNMAQQPLVWIGIGGLLLWRSGVKEARESSSVRHDDTPLSPDPTAAAPSVGEGSQPVPPVRFEAPADRSDPRDPPDNRPRPAKSWLVGVGAVALIGAGLLVGYLLFSPSDTPEQSLPQESPKQTPATTQVVTTASTTVTTTPPTTTTIQPESTTTTDAQIADLVAEVMAIEARERPSPDDAFQYSTDYWGLRMAWDTNLRDIARTTDKAFAQWLSEALIRRSDEFLLWSKWFRESGTMESDDPYYQPALAAREEADLLFQEIRSGTPAQWVPSSVAADGTGTDGMSSVPGDRPDSVAPQDLIVFDCYEEPSSGSVTTLQLGFCSEDSILVYWVEDPSISLGVYPGDERMHQIADDVCHERMGARFPVKSLLPHRIHWWTPNAEMYEAGDTYVICGLQE